MRYLKILLFLLIGLIVGAFSMFIFLEMEASPFWSNTLQSSSREGEPIENLIEESYRVLRLMEKGDYKNLSLAVHPEEGLTFTPYSYVDKSSDLNFSADQIQSFGEDENTYLWGVFDGSGEPIQMTVAAYMERFVLSADYEKAPVVSANNIAKTANSIENVSEAYPECRYVEFHFPGFDPAYEGMDWRSLKLVFLEKEGNLWLTAVIHSQWTI